MIKLERRSVNHVSKTLSTRWKNPLIGDVKGEVNRDLT